MTMPNPIPLKPSFAASFDSNIQRIDKMLEDISLLNKRDNISREPINLDEILARLQTRVHAQQFRSHRLPAHEHGRQQPYRPR